METGTHAFSFTTHQPTAAFRPPANLRHFLRFFWKFSKNGTEPKDEQNALPGCKTNTTCPPLPLLSVPMFEQTCTGRKPLTKPSTTR